MAKQVTFENIGNGYFKILVDGEYHEYLIENMDAGRSGTAKNSYGIFNPNTGKTNRVGTLAAAKKEAIRMFSA